MMWQKKKAAEGGAPRAEVVPSGGGSFRRSHWPRGVRVTPPAVILPPGRRC